MKKLFYEQYALKFECTACGECCFVQDDYYVFITEKEAHRIRSHLGVSKAWFQRRYTERLENGDRVLVSKEDDRCVFLQDDARCAIYRVRPMQCQTYPFWPELVENGQSWRGEARRCEGIGRGDEVSVEKIKQNLARQEKIDCSE